MDVAGTAELIRQANALCDHAGAFLLPSSSDFTNELTSALSMVDGGRKLLVNLLGAVKAGKTAVLNAFLGVQVLPSSTGAQTALPAMVLFEVGRTTYRLVSKAPPPASAGEEGSLRFEHYVTTDHICVEGSARVVREAVKALTDRLRAARETRDNPRSSEAEKSSAQALLDSISLLEVTCPPPEWLSRVPSAILEQLCFMDTPGRGELHNSHVQALADKCLYEADILMVICDYTKLMTDTAREMFHVGAVARPELAGTAVGSQRIILVVNRTDITGMGAVDVSVACATAQDLAMTEMGLEEAPDAFGVSALQKNRSFGVVDEDDDLLLEMLRGSSAKYRRTRNMSLDSLKAYKGWARLAVKSNFAGLEDRILHLATVEMPGLTVATAKSQAGVALYSWRKRVVKMLADLCKDASEHQTTAAELRGLQDNLTRILKEVVQPFVERVGKELRDVNAALSAVATLQLDKAVAACKQMVRNSTFEKKEAAEEYARMCFSTISEALLRSLETARAGTAAKVNTVLRNASQRAVNELWTALKAPLSQVLAPEPLEQCRVLLTGRELVEELERLRDVVIAPVMAPRGLVQNELSKYVSSHAFTVTKQRIVTKTVNMKVGWWPFRRNISFPSAQVENYKENAVNYPVVVSTMTDLARRLIKTLADERVAQCSQVLTEELANFDAKMCRALRQPVETELLRLDQVINAQHAGEEEVGRRCATLREFMAAIEEHQRTLGYEHLNQTSA